MTRRDHRTRGNGHGASQSELPMMNDQENVPQRVEPQPTLTSKQQAKAAELAEQIEREQKECGPRFELIEKIGEGTYGIVFKAQDHKLNQVSLNSFQPPAQSERHAANVYVEFWAEINFIFCLFAKFLRAFCHFGR